MTFRQIWRVLAALAMSAMLSTGADGARAGSGGLGFDFHGITTPCNGDCAVHMFGGRQTTTSPGMAFGFADITQGKYGLVLPTPIWEYDWLDSGIVGFDFSRQYATVEYNGTEILGLEGELGAAQRFGDQTEREFWAALYVRFKWFPWNDLVKTTLGVSTGINYVTGISDYELRVSGNGEGSHLMHYFAPELTFANPEHPERELVFRMHHRSGIKGNGANGTPGFALFNFADTGSTYATFGIRSRF